MTIIMIGTIGIRKENNNDDTDNNDIRSSELWESSWSDYDNHENNNEIKMIIIKT